MSTTTHQPLAIELIESEAAFERLAPEWTELLAASEMDALFLTWEWLFSWWRHLAADCELRLLVLRREGKLLGIAPLALRRASLLQLPPVAALQFLGSGVAGSDYLDLIVRRGHEVEVVDSVRRWLEAAGRPLSLMRMRTEGPGATLVERMSQTGWRAWCGAREVCPFASLRGQSFDSYLAGLGSEHRYALRRKLKRVEGRADARFELARTEAERQAALESLFELHASRWQSRGDAGAFATPALRAFHHEFSRVALAAGWLRLWLLRFDAVPVAAVYGFLYRRRFYFYQGGFDPAFSRDSVGMVLLGVAVRAAIEEGTDELDLLHGTERYKAHWARANRELARWELYPPGTRGWLACEASGLTRDARRMGRLALSTGKRVLSKANQVDHA